MLNARLSAWLHQDDEFSRSLIFSKMHVNKKTFNTLFFQATN